MPAAKPKDLTKRHNTKTDRRKRADGEAAITPVIPLTVTPPSQLSGEVAIRTWTETIAIYLRLPAAIVSILDLGLLTDYCIANQQLSEIDALRTDAMTTYDRASKALETVPSSTDAKTLTALINAVNFAFDELLKLDARCDQKRKMLHTMRQSLYLTPRSRAGYVPPERDPEKKKRSDMSMIIDG